MPNQNPQLQPPLLAQHSIKLRPLVILRHRKALANMEFYVEGGDKNQERAILRLWSVFTSGNASALEALSDMLSSYAEGLESQETKSAKQAAKDIENLSKLMIRVIPFIKAVAKKMPN